MYYLINNDKYGYYFVILNRVKQPILRSFHHYQNRTDCQRAAVNISKYFTIKLNRSD